MNLFCDVFTENRILVNFEKFYLQKNIPKNIQKKFFFSEFFYFLLKKIETNHRFTAKDRPRKINTIWVLSRFLKILSNFMNFLWDFFEIFF